MDETKPPGAKVNNGSVVWATETTTAVCVGPLWTAVVANSLRTAPLVGVRGTENLTVVALLTTLEATLVCVVVTNPPANPFSSVEASTDCGALCLLSPRVLPGLVERGRVPAVDDRENDETATATGTVVFFTGAALVVMVEV